MKRTLKAIGRRYERGAIVVETAITLPILILIVGFLSVESAFYLRQYSAVEKAVHDAAIYLSTAPRTEMMTAGPDGNPAALTLANTIIERELAGLVPSGTSLNLSIVCLYQVGGNQVMKLCTVASNQSASNTLVQLEVSISVPYVDPLTGGSTGFSTEPFALVSYVGN